MPPWAMSGSRWATCVAALSLLFPSLAMGQIFPDAPDVLELSPKVTLHDCDGDEGVAAHPAWRVTPLDGRRWRVELHVTHNGDESIPPGGVRAWMEDDAVRIRYEMDGPVDPGGPVMFCESSSDLAIELDLPREPKQISVYAGSSHAHLAWTLRGEGMQWQEQASQPEAPPTDFDEHARCRFFHQEAFGDLIVHVGIEGRSCLEAQREVVVVSSEGETLFLDRTPLAVLYVRERPGDEPTNQAIAWGVREAVARKAAKALVARSLVHSGERPAFGKGADGACRFDAQATRRVREYHAAATTWIAIPMAANITRYWISAPGGGAIWLVGDCEDR
jgi:hypothetical protein